MRVWFCRNCGYEVASKGRCHQCRAKLIASPIPALDPLPDDDEVGYRLDDWADRARGRLIEALLAADVAHRFEGDELVVATDDEQRVDELVERIAATAELHGGDLGDEPDRGPDDRVPDAIDDEVGAAVQMLLSASRRLRSDPTDMEADAEVAEASAGVFVVDSWAAADDATWAAVGRVTRRLLAALGSEEALEDDIRREAAVLATLLAPLAPNGVPPADSTPATGVGAGKESPMAETADGRSGDSDVPAACEQRDDLAPQAEPAPTPVVAASFDPIAKEDDEASRLAAAALGLPFEPAEAALDPTPDPQPRPEPEPASVRTSEADVEPDRPAVAPDAPSGSEEPRAADGTASAVDLDGDVAAAAADDDGPRVLGGGPETSYEVPDWLPDQRALLTVLLEEAGIAFAWDGADLVVPSEFEAQVEALFDSVGGVADDDDDEARYRSLEELFAAVTRLAADPDDPERGADVIAAAGVVESPTPLGFDDGQWLALRRRTRTLADAIEHGAHPDVVSTQAASLRDSLRAVV